LKRRRQYREKKKFTFYKGLLVGFISGLVVIAIGLVFMYVALDRYEMRVQAEKAARAETVDLEEAAAEKNAQSESAENSSSDTASSDINSASGYSLTGSSSEIPADIAPYASDNAEAGYGESVTKSPEDTSAQAPEADAVPSLPITDEEISQVQATAEAFTRAYAVFSLKRDASGSESLSYVCRSSSLYDRLAGYTNEWGVRYTSDSFDRLEVTDIRRISDSPDKYTCQIACTYSVKSDAGQNSYDLNFNYTLIRDSGRILMYDMQNR
jgi:hypothetical protein